MGKLKLNFLNWKTTVTGILLAVITILSAIGVVTPEQSTGVQTEGLKIIEAINVIIGAISALVLMFKAQDG